VIASIASSAGGNTTNATATANTSAANIAPAGAAGNGPTAVASTPKPNATAVPKVGQTVSVKNWDMTVTGVDKKGSSIQTSTYSTETAVGTFLVVKVDMKNTGMMNFGVNTTDYSLKDAKGNTYSTSSKFLFSGYGKDQGGTDIGGQVPPGVTVHYFIVFDVAPDAAGLKLQFNQDKKPVVDLGI